MENANIVLTNAAKLEAGDVIVYRGYDVRIDEIKDMRPDLFGRMQLRLHGTIIAGPNRVGDEGELTYGFGGVVHKYVKPLTRANTCRRSGGTCACLALECRQVRQTWDD